MLESLLKEFLDFSGELRPEFPDSLGTPDKLYRIKIGDFWQDTIPRLVEVLYSVAEGTKRNIDNQKLMDFLPGYRLIHIDELKDAYASLSLQAKNEKFFPLLSNYSSDYICVKDEKIYNFMHDDAKIVLMHNSSEAFLKTICEFYHRNIFFLDEAGFLDYDFELEGVCGAELNPGIEYWVE